METAFDVMKEIIDMSTNFCYLSWYTKTFGSCTPQKIAIIITIVSNFPIFICCSYIKNIVCFNIIVPRACKIH